MPVQQAAGGGTPARREAFSWAIYKAGCWYMTLHLVTSRKFHILPDLRPLLDAELTRFISTNLILSAYMIVTIGKLLGCLTSRQSEQLQFNLFLHYTFKYVLMRLLLPSNIQGFYTWVAWFVLVGQLHAILGICRCRLEAQLVSPSTTLHSYNRSLMLLMGTAMYSMVTMSFLSEATAGGGELMALARSSEGILGEGMSLTSGLAMAAVKLRGVDTEPHWGNMTASLFMYDLVLAGIECVRLIIHNCFQVMEILVTKRAEMREARAAFLQQQQQHAGSPGSDGSNADNRQTPQQDAASMGGGESSSFAQFKSTFLFHLDLLAELACLSLSGMQHSLLWMIQMGISSGRFHWSHCILGFDYMRILLGVRKRVTGYWHYRAVTKRLKHAFQDVRPLHPESCSICMDTMVVGKQLPCGHQFHLGCLRAWMQQSGAQVQHLTCPNCRQPLMPKASQEEDPLRASDSAHAHANAVAAAHAAAPTRAAAAVGTVMLIVPRFVSRAVVLEYIMLLQLGTRVLLWWVSQLARFLRRYSPSLPARLVTALQTNWPTPEEMEGWGESSEPHEREMSHLDLHPPPSRGPFAWLMRVLGVRSQARDELRMEQQRERAEAEARRRQHRRDGGGGGGGGAAGEAGQQGGTGGVDGGGDGGGIPSLRRRRRRSSSRRGSGGGHGTPGYAPHQGGGGHEVGSLAQQAHQARASLMHAVDLVVAMHLLIEYMFLQGAASFLQNFNISTSYRSPAGMAPPTAATAVQVPVHEGEDMDGEGGRGDGPSGSRAAFPSCSSIAHNGHSFAIAAAGASAAEVASGPMDDGDVSSPMR